MFASEQIKKGDQVYVSFGKKSNLKLLGEYGFIDFENTEKPETFIREKLI